MSSKPLKRCIICLKVHGSGRTVCSTCTTKKYRLVNPIKASFEALKHNAKRRKISFNLTLEEFSLFCFKTDYHLGKGRTKHCLSVDRVNPLVGYEISNIQAMTVSENSKKAKKFLEYDWLTKTAKVSNNFYLLTNLKPDPEVPF